jgi:hypothetical protein
VIWLHVNPWVPPVVTAAVALLGIVVRCLALLVGLLVALSKPADSDRAEIFREYAQAVSRGRSHLAFVARRNKSE